MAFRERDNDFPPNSRLFVIGNKGMDEELYRSSFEKYGTVEDVWIVKDRRTNEEKGITYVKMSKASEAAMAMEELNGRTIEGHPRPLKIVIANNKRDGNLRDPREDERILRLFIIIPKGTTEQEVREEFEKYGDVDFVQILKDFASKEPKGFGYVKFHRSYHAALALESCNPVYKPKFAQPKKQFEDRDNYDSFDYDRSDRGVKRPYGRESRDRNDRNDRNDFGGGGGGGRSSRMRDDDRGFGFGGGLSYSSPMYSSGSGGGGGMFSSTTSPSTLDIMPPTTSTCQRLHIIAPIGLTQSYLNRLFDLIPGLEYCDLNEQTGVAYARYLNTQCAAYARDKLDGFEYPIGTRLRVVYAEGQDTGSGYAGGYAADMNRSGHTGGSGFGSDSGFASSSLDVMHKAAEVLSSVGINPQRVLSMEIERVPYCNIPLPFPQPLLPFDSRVAKRLFIVCQPSSVPEKYLKDAFCRFGDLIDVFLLPNKNYGYAKFTSDAAADKCMQLLHGQTLAGNRIKVLEAEPMKEDDDTVKRPRRFEERM